MKRGRVNATVSIQAGKKPAFRLLTVYEDFAAGRRANETCSFLLAQLGDDFEIRTSMWKFDILEDHVFAKSAVVEALEADAVIIATRGKSPLPAAITGWIERWVFRRADQTGALIGIMDTTSADTPVAAHIRSYLDSVAAAANMDFLINAVPFGPADTSDSPHSLRSRFYFNPHEDFTEQKFDQHWGINE